MVKLNLGVIYSLRLSVTRGLDPGLAADCSEGGSAAAALHTTLTIFPAYDLQIRARIFIRNVGLMIGHYYLVTRTKSWQNKMQTQLGRRRVQPKSIFTPSRRLKVVTHKLKLFDPE